MSSLHDSLPGEAARRWLARIFSPGAMESVFDPFLADLQADWTHAKANRSARNARWTLYLSYVSLVVQVVTYLFGSLFGPSYVLAPTTVIGASHSNGELNAARRSRYAAPLFVAALITFGLFALMSALIASEPGATTDPSSIAFSLIRVPPKAEPLVEPKSVLPVRPEPAVQPGPTGLPVDPQTKLSPRLPSGPTEGWINPNPGVYANPDLSVPSTDHSEIPIVRVPPVYPQRAIDRGVEGWVEVEFTVNEIGGVSDPKVLSAHPNSIFNRAALRAIEAWKYEPKVVGGQPVSRPGMRKRLRFELNGTSPGSD
jgi:protein TonB